MFLNLLLLILGFALLIAGASWLVNGSVSLAKRYKVSELAIGLTIVAFGTSAPELMVNIMASIRKLNDITLGNIIGSNSFNLLLILGISGIIYPLTVQIKTVWKEIPLSLLAALMVLIFANPFWKDHSEVHLGIPVGIVFLVFFIGFLYYIFRNLKEETAIIESDYKIYSKLVTLLLIIAGLALLVFGSRLVVNNAVKIAHYLHVSEKLIGLTIISAGTSLPELATSAVAAYKKRCDIAVGNIIGSNIFNIFFILGTSMLIHPIQYNVKFNVDLYVLIAGTILLFITMFSGKKYKLDRWEAIVLLIGYLLYLSYLIKIG